MEYQRSFLRSQKPLLWSKRSRGLGATYCAAASVWRCCCVRDTQCDKKRKREREKKRREKKRKREKEKERNRERETVVIFCVIAITDQAGACNHPSPQVRRTFQRTDSREMGAECESALSHTAFITESFHKSLAQVLAVSAPGKAQERLTELSLRSRRFQL